MRPSAIFCCTCSGLPSAAACSSKIRCSAALVLLGHLVLGDVPRRGGGHVQGDVARELRKSSVRATKSVSQLTSTSTPILPVAWM